MAMQKVTVESTHRMRRYVRAQRSISVIRQAMNIMLVRVNFRIKKLQKNVKGKGKYTPNGINHITQIVRTEKTSMSDKWP
jgi:hypothetical protein